MKFSSALFLLVAATALTGCGDSSKVAESETLGPSPALPQPNQTLIPTVKIAPAKGWPAGNKPAAGAGLAVNAFATGLDHPRWLYVLPNGDVLVAETSAPERPEEGSGIKGMIYQQVQKRAGAGVPSANRITLLRDTDGDGVADVRTVILKDLYSPFGMALIGNDLYVANTDSVMKFSYNPGDTQISKPGVKFADLPGGPLNHHWTKGLIASRDGSKLYASIGSNSNAGENGLEKEQGRAQIMEIDVGSGQSRTFATGLRNPVGMGWEPQTGKLWAVVNERDELGSDLVPDYLTSVRENGFYGWPFSYYGQHVDTRVKPQNPGLVEKALVPDYALGNHVAALGLEFSSGTSLPDAFRNGAFIGEHGSWNRNPRSGYKVVFVAFENGMPRGKPVDILTAFVSPDGDAYGRPVGVVIDKKGALLVADDVGNAVWRVTANRPAAASR